MTPPVDHALAEQIKLAAQVYLYGYPLVYNMREIANFAPLPADMPVVRTPSGLFAIVGRVAVDGVADLPAVHALQDQFTLTPLSVFEGGAPLIVAGVQSFKWEEIADVWHTGWGLRGVMLVTLALSVLVYLASSSSEARVVEFVANADGTFTEKAPPAVLPSHAVTILEEHKWR